MGRRCCLAIGVSTVDIPANNEGRFAYLDGAYDAANLVGEWAVNSGFGKPNVKVITDQRDKGTGLPNPVNRETIKTAVTQMFPDDAEDVDHFLLYFCGHGLAQENMRDNIFWLLNDSLKYKYKVHVEEFVFSLQHRGVSQITIISDACRSIAGTKSTAGLFADRVIDPIGTEPEKSYQKRLTSCENFEEGFMIKKKNSARPGKCILSSVLLETLWGREPSAIKNGIIDSAQLIDFVSKRAESRAKEYKITMEPVPDQGRTLNTPFIVYDSHNPPADPHPDLSTWPEIDDPTITNLGFSRALHFAESRNLITQNENVLEKFKTDKVYRAKILGVESEPLGSEIQLDVSEETLFLNLPGKSAEPLEELATIRQMSDKIVSPTDTKRAAEHVQRTRISLEYQLVNLARKLGGETAHNEIVEKLALKNTKWGELKVASGKISKIWGSPSNSIARGNTTDTYKISSEANGGNQYLLEFDDGTFAPVTHYQDKCAVISRNVNGVPALIYSSKYDPDHELTLNLIKDLYANSVTSNKIQELAATLRRSKHSNPIFGCVAAYLYRTIGDINNIRRMAYYYAQMGQPIPFDIALLGKLERVSPNRVLVPSVSAVQDTDLDPLPDWVSNSTPSIAGLIGGFCPWLSMGWDYVVSTKLSAEVGSLEGIFEHTKTSMFTAFDYKGGKELVHRWEFEVLYSSH